MSEIRVLIVEDEPLIAEDIKEFLENRNYHVLGIEYEMKGALKQIESTTPDIALLDINLGNNMDGIEIAKIIRDQYQFPFIYLTSYSNKMVLEDAKKTLPMGYIVKPFDENDLFTTIEIALFNHSKLMIPNSFSKTAINQKINNELTDKEFEILKGIYEGKTNQRLSEEHFVSINTIKSHVRRIYEKLDTNSRTSTIATIRSLLK